MTLKVNPDTLANRLIQIQAAMFDPSLPCNPIPFAHALSDLVISTGTDSIRGDSARRILWVLMAQSYGCLATIDLTDEWSRLFHSFYEKPTVQERDEVEMYAK